MTGPITSPVRVDSLQSGDRIVDHAAVWTVFEVLPIYRPGGMAVVAANLDTDGRQVLLSPIWLSDGATPHPGVSPSSTTSGSGEVRHEISRASR